MSKEVWKDIKGYEGLYQVSNLGRVKSVARNIYRNNKGTFCNHFYKEKIFDVDSLEPYPRVTLSKDNKSKHFSIHRLVANAFIPNPNNLPCVNHKDEDKTNNNVNNLEWCTHKYNSNYGSRNDRIIEKQGKKVLCVETNIIYRSVNEAARLNNMSANYICACCNNKCEKAYDFHWRYL